MAAAILDFGNFKYLYNYQIPRNILHMLLKFDADGLKIVVFIVNFRFFNMAAGAIFFGKGILFAIFLKR